MKTRAVDASKAESCVSKYGLEMAEIGVVEEEEEDDVTERRLWPQTANRMEQRREFQTNHAKPFLTLFHYRRVRRRRDARSRPDVIPY